MSYALSSSMGLPACAGDGSPKSRDSVFRPLPPTATTTTMAVVFKVEPGNSPSAFCSGSSSAPVASRAIAPSAGPRITRSTIWYEDGSVVLQAGNMQFRVHRSVLAQRSRVWGELLDDRRRHNGMGLVEGCPVVEVQDSKEDMGHVLGIVYGDGRYMDKESHPIDVVGAMVRLGTKYEIERLVDDGLMRLRKEFPSTLREWDQLDSRFFEYIYDEIGGSSVVVVKTMQLAHGMGIQSILPALYLEAIALVTEGSLDTSADVPFDVQRGWMLGYSALLEARGRKVYGWVSDLGAISECARPLECQAVSRDLMPVLWKPGRAVKSTFRRWKVVERKNELERKLCGGCLEHAEEAHRKGREEVWEKLPGYFGLPEWRHLVDGADSV